MDKSKGKIDVNKEELMFRSNLFWKNALDMEKSAALPPGVTDLAEKKKLINTYRSLSLALRFAAESEQEFAEWVWKQKGLSVFS